MEALALAISPAGGDCPLVASGLLPGEPGEPGEESDLLSLACLSLDCLSLDCLSLDCLSLGRPDDAVL